MRLDIDCGPRRLFDRAGKSQLFRRLVPMTFMLSIGPAGFFPNLMGAIANFVFRMIFHWFLLDPTNEQRQKLIVPAWSVFGQ